LRSGGAIATADGKLIVLESKLDELGLNSDGEEAAGSEEGKTEALLQLEEERKRSKYDGSFLMNCCLSHRKKLLQRPPQGTRAAQ
jgi:hypothetical protein